MVGNNISLDLKSKKKYYSTAEAINLNYDMNN